MGFGFRALGLWVSGSTGFSRLRGFGSWSVGFAVYALGIGGCKGLGFVVKVYGSELTHVTHVRWVFYKDLVHVGTLVEKEEGLHDIT